MRKKAQLLTLRKLIIAGLLAVIIFWIGYEIANIIKTSSDAEACRLSLFAASVWEKGTAGFGEPAIKCPVQYKNFNKQSDEEISRELLSLLNEGVYIAGGEDPIMWGDSSLWKGKISCLIWGVITFEGKARQREFASNLGVQADRFKYPGSDKTIYEYYEDINSKARQNELELGIIFPYRMDSKKDYYIIIRNEKAKTIMELFPGSTAIELGPYVITNDPTVVIIKQIVALVSSDNDNVIKSCDVIVN